jgi:HEAT repeat protein
MRGQLYPGDMKWWDTQRLRSKNPNNRLAVIVKLADTPTDESVQLLHSVLNDTHGAIRKAAVRALGKIRARESIPHLVQALQDAIGEIREEAVIALREIGDPETANHLIILLEDRHPGVRSHAAKTLERFRWQPRNDQERILHDTALGRFVSASDMGLSMLGIVTKTLADGTPTAKLAALDALGKIGGEEVVPTLLGALRDAESSVRVAALEALRGINDPRALQPVTAALNHQDATVRAAAVHALLPYGAEAFPALKRCLTDRNWAVRKAAVETLGRTMDARVAESLIPLLQDPDHDVREVNCEALGRLKSRAAITPLVLVLTDSQTAVRQFAAAALRDIDSGWETLPEAHAALPRLKESLKDRDYWVRQSARDTIRRIEAAEPCGAAMNPPDEKLNAAMQVLVALLRNPQPDLRLAAAEALGRLENREIAGFLSAALPDEDKWVTQALENSLRHCGAPAENNLEDLACRLAAAAQAA